GATPLNLGIVTLGSGTTQAIDVIRRPIANEAAGITAERDFAQASLKILLSDDPKDITNLSCTDTSKQPFELSQLAQPVASWPTNSAVTTLKSNMTANGITELPLAASGAANGVGSSYTAKDGYWLPKNYPIIKGFIKIEAQTAYGTPCGTWKD